MQDIKPWAPASTLTQLLSEREWAGLRELMTERSFVPGDVLVAQGTIEPPFQVISEGVATVVATTPAGERRELGRLGSGECIGEMSLLTGEPASASVVALTPVRAHAIDRDALARVGDLRVRLVEALSSILAGRLKRANERLLARHVVASHVIFCRSENIPAIAALPKEIAATGVGRVLVLVVGEALAGAARAHLVEDQRVTVRRIEEPELVELPAMLAGFGHEYAHALVLTDAALGDIEAGGADLLQVARTPGELPATEGMRVAVVGDRPWTQPELRQLSAIWGRPVIAVLLPDGRPGGPNAPIARLARTMTHRTVGLALGAGAAKGLAHLGVLRALDDLQVPIDVITGCSIGSAIAAGRAAGLSVAELTEAVERVSARAVRPTLPLRSFLSNRGIRDALKQIAGERRFEDLDIPLALVATDLFRRSAVTFTSGVLWPCIMASMALPGVYPPVPANGSYLVDGAVLNPVPVAQCRELGAGLVIGVRLTGKHTSPREQLDVRPSRPFAVETISRTFEIMNNRISEMSNEQADVTVEVSIERGGIRDFRHGEAIAVEGERAILDARERLAAVMPYVRTA